MLKASTRPGAPPPSHRPPAPHSRHDRGTEMAPSQPGESGNDPRIGFTGRVGIGRQGRPAPLAGDRRHARPAAGPAPRLLAHEPRPPAAGRAPVRGARRRSRPGRAHGRAVSARPGVLARRAGAEPDRPPEERTRIVTLVAAPLRSQIRPGVSVPAWAYNASVPAPEIRGVQGELLRVVLCNELPAPVTIALARLSVPWRQDGVAGMTQDAVQPGATYVYQFRLTIPGTYWYHSHQDWRPRWTAASTACSSSIRPRRQPIIPPPMSTRTSC